MYVIFNLHTRCLQGRDN